jgi:hypothetical protein
MKLRLGDIAYARSGDKGAGSNIGVIAHTPAAYALLTELLTFDVVARFFQPLNPGPVRRYELPNLLAFNFILPGVLAGGGSLSLRIDAQGKALGQAIIELRLEISDEKAWDLISP